MTRIGAVLIGIILCTASSPSAIPQHGKDSWVPTLADVKELESHLTEPGAAELAKSTRFYYGFYEDGHQVIHGDLLGEGSGRDMKIHIAPKFPTIFDGGCSVINLSYDPIKRVILSLRCNGRA